MRKRFVTSKNLNSSGADQAYFLYFLQKGNEHPPKQVRGIMLEKSTHLTYGCRIYPTERCYRKIANLRSNEHYLSSSENNAWKNLGLN